MYHFIVNPSSKSGNGRRLWDGLKSRLDGAGIKYGVFFSEGPGDALREAGRLASEVEQTAQSAKKKLVVMGGDGTLNEVISGIGEKNAFDGFLMGYIPTGSSNDFARGMKLTKDAGKLFDCVMEAKTVRTIDVGRLTYNHRTRTLSRLHDDNINEVRHFAVSAGIGFDAAVCEEALSSGTKNFLNRIGLGKLTYGAIALRQLMSADKIPVELTADENGPVKLDHFLFAAMMNGPYEGGGFKFAPDADISDGLFNICLIGDMSKPRMLYSLPFAYFGKHYGLPGVYHLKAARVRIKTELPMWVHTDGEVAMKSDDILLECLPGALDFMV